MNCYTTSLYLKILEYMYMHMHVFFQFLMGRVLIQSVVYITMEITLG